MKERVTALVACGTGIATSTAVRDKVKKALEGEGYDVEMKQCKISELKAQVDNVDPDVVISTGPVEGNYGAPVVNGVNFLTGQRVEQTIEEIVSVIEE